MTHWKLWTIEPVIPPERRDPGRLRSPGRREMRLLCEGRLIQHNRGSQRFYRRDERRLARETARVKQGLLPNPLRWR